LIRLPKTIAKAPVFVAPSGARTRPVIVFPGHELRLDLAGTGHEATPQQAVAVAERADEERDPVVLRETGDPDPSAEGVAPNRLPGSLEHDRSVEALVRADARDLDEDLEAGVGDEGHLSYRGVDDRLRDSLPGERRIRIPGAEGDLSPTQRTDDEAALGVGLDELPRAALRSAGDSGPRGTARRHRSGRHRGS
jgi:hypothetical protein